MHITCPEVSRNPPSCPVLALFRILAQSTPFHQSAIKASRPSLFLFQTSNFLPLALFRRIGRVHHDAWGTAALSGDPSRGRLGYMRCPFGSALCRDATFCVSSHRMHRSRRYARDARYCVSTGEWRPLGLFRMIGGKEPAGGRRSASRREWSCPESQPGPETAIWIDD